MSESNIVTIEFDDRRYEALADEAERLGITISEVVERASAAWLNDIAESADAAIVSASAAQ